MAFFPSPLVGKGQDEGLRIYARKRVFLLFPLTPALPQGERGTKGRNKSSNAIDLRECVERIIAERII
jgi:hypothetical protein